MKWRNNLDELLTEAQTVSSQAEHKQTMNPKRENTLTDKGTKEFNKKQEKSLSEAWERLSSWTNVSKDSVFECSKHFSMYGCVNSSQCHLVSPNSALVPRRPTLAECFTLCLPAAIVSGIVEGTNNERTRLINNELISDSKISRKEVSLCSLLLIIFILLLHTSLLYLFLPDHFKHIAQVLCHENFNDAKSPTSTYWILE